MASNGYEAGTVLPGTLGEAAQQRGTDPPNVLLIVLDATGYAQLGCYGSPIATPNIDALAANGLLYTNMRTTASCAPSRSCILTGRNHHANAMPTVTGAGCAPRDARIPFENGFLSEMLLQRGYNTYMVGKWELAPAEEETAAGPYDRWPLGRGFERFYGFLGGATDPWYPDLVYDNHQVPPPRTPEEGYHLTEDLADRAIGFIADAKQVAPDKPFLLHFCPGVRHAAHHVPRHWADRYRGRFDDGWDAYRERALSRQKQLGIAAPEAELPRHDPDVPEWDSLPPGTRRRAARTMEGIAGLLSHTDHHIGRLVGFLREIGEFDNTLVMVLSDSAATDPGAQQGATGTGHDPWGWTFAGNTPLRRWKRDARRGGAGAPFVVHWPRGIAARGELRPQYTHLVDIVPTVLDVLTVGPPTAIRGVTQAPLHGISFAPTLHDAGAPARHRTQYFEMFGHRVIDHDRWRAVCPGPGPSLGALRAPITSTVLDDIHAHRWELYHLATDIAENHDLAAEHHDKLVELVAMWYVEARTYGVLPLAAGPGTGTDTGVNAVTGPLLPLRSARSRQRFTFWPGTQTLPGTAGPRIGNRAHSITADVDIPRGGAEGVLLCQGGGAGGWSFYLRERRLHYAHNVLGREIYHVSSPETVREGSHHLRFEFQPTGPPDLAGGRGAAGRALLSVDGDLVGAVTVPATTPVTAGPGRLTCGANPGSPVTSDYRGPFRFTGTLHRVVVELGGAPAGVTENGARPAAARG